MSDSALMSEQLKNEPLQIHASSNSKKDTPLTQYEASIPEAGQKAKLAINAEALNQEINWFRLVLETRLSLYFENECEYQGIDEILPPDLSLSPSSYAEMVATYQMSTAERLLVILTLIPHLRPDVLNVFFIKDQNIDKPFVEFGGWQGKTHLGFLPTGETAAFVLAGADLEKRLHMLEMLEPEHFFSKEGILELRGSNFSESYLTSSISISNEFFHRLTKGSRLKPDFSINFPAKLIETNLDWDDLVLPTKVLNDIEHLNIWLKHQDTIRFSMGLDKSIKPGFRALFYGPPGTGKTLTASVLGKAAGMDVYRIDISSVVSKYIGETEKNLESIFNQAENKNWILFFDEADALFGKRTQTSSSNDRMANQEISYLLQRVETFPGVVILATNLKDNIDEAFSRRFQAMTFFPMPDSHHRLLLWQKALSANAMLDDDVDLNFLAKEHEIAGGAIINVIRFAAINALKMGREKIQQQDFLQGISKEQRKEGRMF